MLDIRFIRENKDIVAAAAKKKHAAFDVEELIAVDDKRKSLLSLSEGKRAEQNAANSQIASAASESDRAALIAKMKLVKADFEKADAELKETMKVWQDLMLHAPNVPDMSVPDGASDADNKEIKTWGAKPRFSFEAKDHVELMTALDMVDFERAAKVHGFRGYFLTGDGVRLCFAIWNYAMDFFTAKSFTPVMPPVIVRKLTMYGTGYLPDGEEVTDVVIRVADDPLIPDYFTLRTGISPIAAFALQGCRLGGHYYERMGMAILSTLGLTMREIP